MVERPELKIHLAVVEHFNARARPNAIGFHVPNAPRSARAGALLKRMGMLAGVSDLIFLRAGEAFALELKAPGNRPTPAQDRFITKFIMAGGHANWASGLDEAILILENWGLIK